MNNNQKLKKDGELLIDTYRTGLGDEKEYHINGALSALMMMNPWCEDKYFKVLYKTPTMDCLLVGKERDALFSISEDLFNGYAKDVLRGFLNGVYTIEYLQGIFYEVKEKIDSLYKENIVNPKETLKKACDLGSQLFAYTIYVEYLDKKMIESEIGTEISDDDWEYASNPAFENFEARWQKLFRNAKSTEEVEFTGTDYYFVKDSVFIEEEIQEAKRSASIEPKKFDKKVFQHEWQKFISFIMELRDYRKDPMLKYLTIIARCTKAMYPNLDSRYLPLVSAIELMTDNTPTEEELKERASGYVILMSPDRSLYMSTSQYEETKEKIENELMKGHDTEYVRGQTGSKGKVTGRARIVLDPHNVTDFNEGDILVSSMTRPEFLQLMKKASAFVTDEGSVTCHAAIIAREMKKPCIIGTKIATKVLKDGDMVEVDAEKGIVRKI